MWPRPWPWARALILAFATGASGKGALKLWPLFGAVNQTLAALALIIITLYLKTKGGWKWLVAGIPAVFMSVMTIWAVVMNQFKFGAAHNMLLQVINLIILVIAVWIAIEGLIKFFEPSHIAEDPEPVIWPWPDTCCGCRGFTWRRSF
jgi:carbon starvation protein